MVFGRDVLQSNLAIHMLLPNLMILSGNVLDLRVVLWIFGEGYCSLIIAIDDHCLGVRLALLVHLIQQVA